MTTREDYIRGSLALHLAELVPPVLRQSLISDEAFSASLGLATDGVISFSASGAAFQRSGLMAAVRAASKEEEPVAIPDRDGASWSVRFDRQQSPPMLVIENGGHAIHVRHLGLLSERLDDRRAMFEAEAQRVNLPLDTRDRWTALIADHSLSDAEMSDFAEDIQATPVAVSATIIGTLGQGTTPLDVLVPRSAAYYERLVGRWQGETTIAAYADSALPAFFDELLAYDAAAGLRLALLLCGHPVVVDCLAKRTVSPSALDAAARWARDGGDAMTRAALLELALLRDDILDQTKPVLAEIASSLGKPSEGADEDFALLSAAFVVAYGQLSHLKILAGKPTFWRRLAALAQAALMVRCFSGRRGALGSFAEDLRAIRARPFALQVQADMRLGPMWQAEYAFPSQLRNEFIGRVLTRAAGREEALRALGLHEIVLGEEGSLKSSVDLYLMFRAGPLEDDVPLVRALEGENLTKVEAGLMEANPNAQSFAALVNSVVLFRQSIELADKAAAALQRAQYRLEAESQGIFLTALWGLATCAAVNRSAVLADAVFTVIRAYRRLTPDDLDMDNAVRIGSIACASREELAGWADAVGGFLAEFAFQSLTPEEAAGLEIYIRDYCDLVPELWASCGQALAAAQAVAA